MKDLLAVNNQVAEAGPGHEEFPHYDPDKGHPHIDLQGGDHGGDTGRQDHLLQHLESACPKGPDQLDLVGIHPFEAGVDHDNGDDDRNGQGHGDDGLHAIAQEDDEEGAQGRLGRAV